MISVYFLLYFANWKLFQSQKVYLSIISVLKELRGIEYFLTTMALWMCFDQNHFYLNKKFQPWHLLWEICVKEISTCKISYEPFRAKFVLLKCAKTWILRQVIMVFCRKKCSGAASGHTSWNYNLYGYFHVFIDKPVHLPCIYFIFSKLPLAPFLHETTHIIKFYCTIFSLWLNTF